MVKEVRKVREFEVAQCTHLNGVLLSFTPAVLTKVGGFKIMPAKWGHEHVNWTIRIRKAGLTPFWADVVDSNNFIGLGPHSAATSLTAAVREDYADQNKKAAYDVKQPYLPIVE